MRHATGCLICNTDSGTADLQSAISLCLKSTICLKLKAGQPYRTAVAFTWSLWRLAALAADCHRSCTALTPARPPLASLTLQSQERHSSL